MTVHNKTFKRLALQGSGGAKGASGPPVEAEDTLQSNHVIRTVEVLGEGPIHSIVEVYLNEVALLDDNGDPNFEGVEVLERLGTPDQQPVDGFSDSGAETLVDTQVTTSIPVLRTITNSNTDACKIVIKLPSLFEYKENGDLTGQDVSYNVQYRPTGGSWIDIADSPFELEDEKAASAVFLQHRFNLTGSAPWDIRVVRITDDNEDNSKLQNDTYFYSYEEIINQKFTYRNTAYMTFKADAQQFGDRIPSRAALVKGLICQVPSNFDTDTRQYTGIWDGTFKDEWTDCPAWCTRDLIVKARYGLGDYIDQSLLDDTTLYTISQYCAAQVDNGDGGTEHRFTFNAYIGSRQQAFDMINAFVSVFRGMAYWSLGLVMFTQDRPTDPILNVTRANTVSGEFGYEGVGLNSVHNRINVTWNDPENFYKADVVPVDDPDHILEYGLRSKDIVAFGCTSKSQAIRAGRWVLYTERMEADTATYVAGPDHVDIVPGSVVRLADPRTMGRQYGGRVLSYSGTTITLDREVVLEANETYELSVVDENRVLHYRTVTTAPGAESVLTVDAVLPVLPRNPKESVWTLSRTIGIQTPLYRVLANQEIGPHQYRITALFHDPDKYALVEGGYNIPFVPEPLLPTGPLPAPFDLRAMEQTTDKWGAESTSSLYITMIRPPDPRIRGIELQYRRRGQTWNRVDLRMNTSHVLDSVVVDRHQVRARTYDTLGNNSGWSRVFNRDVTGTPINPSVPVTGVTAATITAGFQQLAIDWANPSLPNFQHVEVWTNTVSNFGTATRVAQISGDAYDITGLPNGATRHVWLVVITYNQAQTNSLETYVGSGTTTQINSADLSSAITNSITTAQSTATAAGVAAATASNEASQVQTNLDNEVANLQIDYTATQTAASNAQAARDQAIAARDLAQGYQNAASTAQTGAETASSQAQTARTQAQSAQSDAEDARDLAENHADAAAVSESNSASSAVTAGTARDSAVSAAGQASSSASAASTSESNAATYRSDALSAASASQASSVASEAWRDGSQYFRNEANTSATAAASSATSAAASDTSAGQNASTANTNRVAAETARASAEGHATSAATSATTATSAASQASVSEGVSVSTVSKTLPSDFTEDGTFWTKTVTGLTLNGLPLEPEWTFHDTSDGRTMRGDTNAIDIVIAGTRAYIATKPFRDYRITLRARQLSGALTNDMVLQLRSIDDGQIYNAGNSSAISVIHTALNQTTEFVLNHNTGANPSPFVRPLFYIRSSVEAGHTHEILSLDFEDVTSQLSGEASAAAAATSASNASASETSASQDANAAASSATSASTSQGQALTYRNEAAASATSASGSATTATTQAGLSATARNASQAWRDGSEYFRNESATSATSAATSATNASASATTAGQQATIASTERLSAETASGNSSASAGAAATSASNALGSAQSAATSEEVTAEIVRDLLPYTFGQDGLYWTANVQASPDATSPLTASWVSYAPADNRSADVSGAGSSRVFGSRGVVPTETGRTYRLTVEVMQTQGTLSGFPLTLWHRRLDEDYSDFVDVFSSYAMTAMSTWETHVREYTNTGHSYTNLRAMVSLNSNAVTGDVFRIRTVRLEDVTDEVLGQANAAAAATSASNAAASETAAGQQASASQQSATAAQTSQGSASTSASNASTSASNASTSATDAASSETGAATSETNAANSASSAAGSANTATSQASLATTAKNSAQSDATSASQSASAAATSSSNASGFASTAQTQASLATTAKNNAETAEGNASQSASAAAASSSTAEGFSTSASTSAELAARVGPNGTGVLDDPYFDKYNLGTWASWGTAASTYTEDNQHYPTGKTIGYNIAADTTAGHSLYSSNWWSGPEGLDAYVVELDFTLWSGSHLSAGVVIDWNYDNANVRRSISIDAMAREAPIIGKRTTVSGVIYRNFTATGTYQSHDIWVMAGGPSFFGETCPARNIRFHRVFVRPATSEELGLGEVGAQLSATVATEAAARATDVAALTSTQTTQASTIGTLSATVGTQGATLATLSGVVQASTGISAVTQTEGGVTSVASLRLTSYADPDGSIGSVIQMDADNTIVNGTMSVDKLVSAPGGGNQVQNSRFEAGLANWIRAGTGTSHVSTVSEIREAGTTWSGTDYPTLMMYQTDAATGGYSEVRCASMSTDGTYDNRGFPVEEGKWYGVGVQASTHRCSGVVYIFWRDANGGYLSATSGAIANNVVGSSDNPEAWDVYWAHGEAPAGAVYGQVAIRKQPTNTGTTSFVFIHKPFTFVSHEFATQPPEWSPAGVTAVHGGQVVTDTILASAVNTVSFNAAGLAVFGNAMQSSNFNGTVNSAGDLTSEGTTGWAIGASGEAVFNGLVVRSWVEVGAVSDGVTYTQPSPSGVANGGNVTWQTLGPLELGTFWQIAVQFKSRIRRKYGVYYSNKSGTGYHLRYERTSCVLQWRTKEPGSGTFSSWSNLHNFGRNNSVGTSYATYETVVSKMGVYDDVELRMYVTLEDYSEGGTQNADPGDIYYSNFDDVTLVARALVR